MLIGYSRRTQILEAEPNDKVAHKKLTRIPYYVTKNKGVTPRSRTHSTTGYLTPISESCALKNLLAVY